MVPIDGTTLVDHWVFVLGGDQEVFDGSATFEVSLDAIPTTDLFDTFTKTLCVGYDNVPLVLHFMVSRLGTVVVPSFFSTSCTIALISYINSMLFSNSCTITSYN